MALGNLFIKIVLRLIQIGSFALFKKFIKAYDEAIALNDGPAFLAICWSFLLKGGAALFELFLDEYLKTLDLVYLRMTPRTPVDKPIDPGSLIPQQMKEALMDPTVAILTEEKMVDFDLVEVDGRDRVVPVDGTPTVAVSDDTVADVSIAAHPDTANAWVVTVVAKAASPEGVVQTVNVTTDADLGPDVKEVTGFGNFVVTTDERTGQRFVRMVPRAPVDKPI